MSHVIFPLVEQVEANDCTGQFPIENTHKGLNLKQIITKEKTFPKKRRLFILAMLLYCQ